MYRALAVVATKAEELVVDSAAAGNEGEPLTEDMAITKAFVALEFPSTPAMHENVRAILAQRKAAAITKGATKTKGKKRK